MAKKPQSSETESDDAPKGKPPTPAQLEEDKYWANRIGYGDAQAATIWSYDDTGHQLTIEQQLFCRSYIIDRNPVAALRRLNYAGDNDKLKKMAARILTSTEVQGCIETLAQRLMEKLEVTAESVQKRIAEVAFFDPRSVLSFDQFTVDILHSRYWTEAQARAVQSVKMGKEGVEIKFYDALRASEMLAKQLKLLPDDNTETAAAASRAAAEAVVDKIFSVFDKEMERGSVPAIEGATDGEVQGASG